MRGGGEPGATAKDQEIGERVAAESIRAVKTGGSFTSGEKAGHCRLSSFGIHANAAIT